MTLVFFSIVRPSISTLSRDSTKYFSFIVTSFFSLYCLGLSLLLLTRKDDKSEEKSTYVTQWFDCRYVAKEKQAYFLRNGGVLGAKMKEYNLELIKSL